VWGAGGVAGKTKTPDGEKVRPFPKYVVSGKNKNTRLRGKPGVFRKL